MYISSMPISYHDSIFSPHQLFMVFETYLKIHNLQLFHYSKSPVPFPALLLVRKTMLCLPRSHSFFLCAFRKNKGPSEVEDTEAKCGNTVTVENGIPRDPLDMKGGHINDTFLTEEERLTPL